ncbi:MAG: Ig-like domain-containing protein [Candidatus Manganitrophaceae bacterium]|nr:MAG: Ig-like domain-containing protein [Candidatus Manganitrophaceae bacterium]
MRDQRKMVLLVLLFSGLLIYQGGTAFAITITNPTNGATFNQGDTVTIRVEPSPGDPDLMFVQIFPPRGTQICPELTRPPYECHIKFSAETPREVSIGALARSFSDALLEAEDITVFVRVTATLQGLRVNDNQLFLRVGGNEQLLIYGQYSDGVERHVEDPATGTTYQSTDPRVATVDEKGLVTAIAPGKAVITVKNANKQLQIQVNVKPKK